jgi:RsiW-degrading membrane proteinase PrsW (M82 family)
MAYFFLYFFNNPSILGWGLAIIFTAIWLACYRPPLFSKLWLWGVFFAAAVLAPVAIDITSFPIGYGLSTLLRSLMSQETIQSWSWLLSIPSIFIFGLVWEGAKLLPVAVYWWWADKEVEPKLGLLVGVVAGAGFGWLLSQWTFNYFIASNNWTWQLLQVEGFPAISAFFEGFFTLGLNVASTALAGWGLAKGWGWKFYLVACSVFLVANYTTVLVGLELISALQAQFFIATWALIVAAVSLWLLEKKTKTKASRRK